MAKGGKSYRDITITYSADATNLSAELSKIKAKQDEAAGAAKRLQDALKLDPSSTNLMRDAMGRLEEQVGYAKERVKALQDALEHESDPALTKRLNEDLDIAQAKLKDLESQLSGMGQAMEGAGQGQGQGSLMSTLSGLGETVEALGGQLTRHVTVPLTAISAAAMATAVSMDTALTDVRKTVDGTAEDYERLKQSAIEFSQTNAVSADEVLQIEALGAQLGFAIGELEEFGRVASGLEISTNMDAETASTNMAQFANITGMAHDQIESYASSIVALGNNMATTESDISNMAQRIASAGSQAGMSEADILGMAAALASVGMNAEAGGSAISTVINKISTSVAKGGEDLEGWAAAAGMSAEQFAAAWETAPTEALSTLLATIGSASEAGENMTVLLEELGVKELRQSDAMRRLAGNADLVTQAVALSNQAWQEQTALSDEVANRNDSLAAKAEMLQNRLAALLEQVGAPLAEAMNSLLDVSQPLLEAIASGAQAFADMDAGAQQAIVSTLALVAAIGPAISTVSAISKDIGALQSIFGTLSGALDEVILHFVSAGGAAGTLAGAIGSLGPVLATGLVGAGIFVAVSAIGTLVSSLVEWEQHNQLVREATEGLAEAVQEGATALEGATQPAEAYARSADEIRDATEGALRSVGDFADSISGTLNDVADDGALVSQYAETIKELGNKGSITEEQLAELKTAIDKYNSATGASIEITDDVTGAMNVSAESIDRVTEAYIRNAEAQAYVELYEEAFKQSVTIKRELTKATEELREAEHAHAEESPVYIDSWLKENERIDELRKSQEELQATYDSLTEQMEYFKDNMSSSAHVFNDLTDALESAGVSAESWASLTEEQMADAQDAFSKTGGTAADAMRVLREAVGAAAKSVSADMEDAASSVSQSSEEIRRAIEDATTALKRQQDEAYTSEKRRLEDIYSDTKSELDKKHQLEKDARTKSYNEQKDSYSRAEAAQKEANSKAENELKKSLDKQYEIKKSQLKDEYDLRKQAYSDELDLLEDTLSREYELKESQFDDEYNAQKDSYSKQESALRDALSKQLSAQRDAYSKELSEYKKQLSAQEAALKEANSRRLNEIKAAHSAEEAELDKSLDAQYKMRQKEYSKVYKQWQKENSKILKEAKAQNKAETDAFKAETKARIAAIKEEYEEKKRLYELSDGTSEIDAQIKAIEDEQEAEEAARKQRERDERLSELRLAVERAKTRRTRQDAEAALSEYLQQIAEEDADAERQRQIQALEDKRDAIAAETEAVQDGMDAERDAKIAAYEEQRAIELAALEDTQDQAYELLSEKLSEQLELRKEQQDAALEQYREELNAELEALKNQHQAERDAEAEQMAAQLARLEEENAARAEAMAEWQSQMLEQMAEANAAEIERVREANAAALEELRAVQQQELDGMAEAQDQQLRDLADLQEQELKNLADTQSGELERLKEDQERELQAAKDINEQNLQQLKDTNDQSLQQLSDTNDQVLQGIADANDRILTDLKRKQEDALTKLKNDQTDAVTALKRSMEDGKTAVETNAKAASKSAQDNSEKAKNEVTTNADAIRGKVDSTSIIVKNKVSETGNDIKGTFDSTTSHTETKSDQNTKKIKSLYDTLFDGLGPKANQGMDALANGIDLGGQKSERSAETVASGVETKFNLRDPLSMTGFNSVGGFESGMWDKAQELWNAATEIAEGVLSAFNINLQIASPSKELMKTGRFADEGLIKGLQEGERNVLLTAQSLADGLADTLVPDLELDELRGYVDEYVSEYQEMYALVEALAGRHYDEMLEQEMEYRARLSDLASYQPRGTYDAQRAEAVASYSTQQCVNVNFATGSIQVRGGSDLDPRQITQMVAQEIRRETQYAMGR